MWSQRAGGNLLIALAGSGEGDGVQASHVSGL